MSSWAEYKKSKEEKPKSWAEYKKSKETPTDYQTYVERPAQIALGSAAAGIRAAPRTAYDISKHLTATPLGGIAGPLISKGIQALEKATPESIKKGLGKAFPSYEEVRETQKNMGLPQAEGPFEGFLEKTGRFAGESAIPLIKGGQKFRQVASLMGAAAGAQLGEEAGLNPFGQAVLTVGGSLFGRRLGGVRTPTQRMTPEVERYIQASRDLGIDPLATGMNPSQLQKAAQKWATHGLGGHELFENAYRSRSDQVSRQFATALDEAGEALFHEPYEAGTALRENIQEATQQVERTKSTLYRAIDQTLPPNASITPHNPQTFLNQADQTLQALEQTISQTPKEAAAYRRLVESRDAIQDMLTHPTTTNELPIRQLEASVRSLNDVIRWDRPGGADKLLIPFRKTLDDELKRYGRINTRYGGAREAANTYFRDNVVQIRQNILQSIARGERPESALNIMNTVSGIRNVEQALSHLPDGQRIFNALKRYKLQSLLLDKVIDPSTGLMRLPTSGTGLQNFLSKKTDFYPTLRELAGPQAIQRLQRLEHVGEGLAKGFNALSNPSRTADTALALYQVLTPGKNIAQGLGRILKGDLGGIFQSAQGAAHLLAPRMMAEMILNPQFADRIYEASRAANSGDWQRFNRIISAIDVAIKDENQQK